MADRFEGRCQDLFTFWELVRTTGQFEFLLFWWVTPEPVRSSGNARRWPSVRFWHLNRGRFCTTTGYGSRRNTWGSIESSNTIGCDRFIDFNRYLVPLLALNILQKTTVRIPDSLIQLQQNITSDGWLPSNPPTHRSTNWEVFSVPCTYILFIYME